MKYSIARDQLIQRLEAQVTIHTELISNLKALENRLIDEHKEDWKEYYALSRRKRLTTKKPKFPQSALKAYRDKEERVYLHLQDLQQILRTVKDTDAVQSIELTDQDIKDYHLF